MIHDENEILKANKILLEYLETNEDDFIGQFPTHFVLEESLPKVQEVISQYEINNYVTYPVIIKVLTAKGKIKEFQATPHFIEYNGKNCIEVSFVDLTETIKLEQEKIKTQDLLQSILDNSTNYILRVDSLGNCTFANKTYIDKVQEDPVGLSIFAHVDEADFPKLNKLVEEIVSSEKDTFEITLTKIDKFGNTFLTDWIFKVIYEEDELYVQCIGRDITEIEEVKYELNQSQEIYQLASNLGKIAYWEFNPNTQEVFWSDELFEMLGRERTELSLDFVREVSGDDDVDIAFKHLELAKEFKKEYNYYQKFKHVDGRIFTFECTIKPLYNSKDELTHFIVIVRDITEEEKRIEIIKRNELLHKATIDSLSEGIVLQDRDDKIILHNTAAEKILGLTSDQLIGVSSFDPRWRAVGEDGKPLDGSQHPSVVTNRTGKPVSNFIMGVHRPNNSFVWILINSEPVSFNNDCVIDATATSFSDITMMLDYQKEIADQELRFRTMFNNSPYGKIICNMDNVIITVNKKTQELFKKTEKELLGKQYESLFIDSNNENESLISLIN